MDAIWTTVKAAVRERIPGHSYRMWIESLEYVKGNEDGIVVSCPNLFFKKKVRDHYSALIEEELENTGGRKCGLSLEIASRKKSGGKERSGGTVRVNADEPARGNGHAKVNGNGRNGQKDVVGPKVVRPKTVYGKSSASRSMPISGVRRQLSLPGVGTQLSSGRMLRRGFTFDNFVVGGNCDFAYSAALSLASRRTTANNALFLHSKTGMGKSHLSQAIGHHILADNPGDNVYYVTAEDFTNEMVRSFREGTIDGFKEKFRKKCDVLLLEDVHFLTGKERTQIELALTLDYLFEADKKIIFSSCYLPGDIPKLNDQLQSRLSGGLISQIDEPDYKTRYRILRNKALGSGCDVPIPVTEYLASELTDNVRQLESGLIGVTAKSSLLGVPIDIGLAESVVKNIARQSERITIGAIKKLVCAEYNISSEELVSKSRKQAIVRPRQMAMYLSRKFTDQPLQVIGKSFNRYHATAIHAINAVEQGIRDKGPVHKHFEYLTKKLDTAKI